MGEPRAIVQPEKKRKKELLGDRRLHREVSVVTSRARTTLPGATFVLSPNYATVVFSLLLKYYTNNFNVFICDRGSSSNSFYSSFLI